MAEWMITKKRMENLTGSSVKPQLTYVNMYKEKKILGLIPARGGSKGIPGKNIVYLGGKPLITWTVEAAKKSRYLDELVLSSDDEEIINIANQYGCNTPFQRPSELAKDDTTSIDVVLHAIEKIPGYDYVLLLQPTSPFRKVNHIDRAIRECIDAGVSSLVTVRKVRESPYWMYTKSKDNRLHPVLEQGLSAQRQNLPVMWILNGAIYLTEINYLKQHRSLKGEDVIGMEMSTNESVDIDSIEDLKYAEVLINNDEL